MTVNGGGEGIKLVVVDSVFLGLSCLAVILRLCARGLRKQSLQLNDWLITIALVFQIGQSVLEDLNGAFGDVALSSTQETPASESWADKLSFPGAVLWGIPLLFIRLSVIHFYYAMFPTRKFRWLCIVMVIIVLIFFVAYTTIVVLSCIPISMDWDKSVHGNCIDVQLQVLVTAAVNVGLDLLLVLLPMPVVWRLQLPVSKRLMICAIFGGGFSVCAVAGLRVYYFTQTGVDSEVNYYLTTILEPDLGTIVACLPLLHPIVRCCTLGRRSGTPDSDRTHVIRWSPDESTLPDDEEMAKRVYREEMLARQKQRPRNEEEVDGPRLEPRAELHGEPRTRPANRDSRDRPLSRIFFGLSASRPISWRRRSDWPLSEDVERELSGKNSARDSGASALHEPLDVVKTEATARASNDTAMEKVSRSNTPMSEKPPSRSNTLPTNPERTRTLDSTTSSLRRKNSAAQRLTSAAAALDHPIAPPRSQAGIEPQPEPRVEARSEALTHPEDPSRWESRTPNSPLRSPTGRSPALIPSPKRSPALAPGTAPPLPSMAEKAATPYRNAPEAAPTGNTPAPSRLTVEKNAALVSNPNVLTPGAAPTTTTKNLRAEGNGERKREKKVLPQLDAPGVRDSVSAGLESAWGKEVARSVAAVTKQERN